MACTPPSLQSPDHSVRELPGEALYGVQKYVFPLFVMSQIFVRVASHFIATMPAPGVVQAARVVLEMVFPEIVCR